MHKSSLLILFVKEYYLLCSESLGIHNDFWTSNENPPWQPFNINIHSNRKIRKHQYYERTVPIWLWLWKARLSVVSPAARCHIEELSSQVNSSRESLSMTASGSQKSSLSVHDQTHKQHTGGTRRGTLECLIRWMNSFTPHTHGACSCFYCVYVHAHSNASVTAPSATNDVPCLWVNCSLVSVTSASRMGNTDI